MSIYTWLNKSKTGRKLIRWYRKTFLGWVELRIYSEPSEDEDTQGENYRPYDCYIERKLIPKEELPPHAVHCTGEPGVYSLDKVHVRYNPHDGGYSATDGWHWMKYDGFEDSLSPKWTNLDHLDMKKVLMIGGVAILVCLIIFALTKG